MTHPAIVVGGGISGLVCAYALRKAGIDALVVEASPRAGGLIQSEQREGFLLELGPQSFSGTSQLSALCEELGIADQRMVAPPRALRYVLVNGKLTPVPLSPPAMLISSLLSSSTKWKIARDAFGTSHSPEDDESIAQFVRRKFGAELLDRLVGPFVSGIYAGDPERLSLRAAFPSLYEAEKSAGSVIRGMMRAAKAKKGPRDRPTLMSFRQGNETLVRGLVARLGTAVRSGTEVVAISTRRTNSPPFDVCLRKGSAEERLSTNKLIIAVPSETAGALLRDVNPAFEPVLCGIEHAAVAVVSFGYRRADVAHSLDGFGFLAPRSSGLRVLGTVWNSSLFPGRAPDGQVLMTSFVGGAADPAAAGLSEHELVEIVHRELAGLLGIGGAPMFSAVRTYRRALPQSNLGHTERMAALETLRTSVPGLALVGNYLRGPAVGACVEHAVDVAASVARACEKPQT
jgi:protoporphyrinogen/coproporphyrinogen III oxidase